METSDKRSRLRKGVRFVLQFFVNSLWIFWLGGLTFYMAVVVPVASEAIGSETQGAVTKQVAIYLNAFGSCCAVLMIGEGWIKQFRIQMILGLIMLVPQLLLFWLRHELALHMVKDPRSFFSDWDFYSAHRVYLCMQTLVWTAAVAIECLRVHRFASGYRALQKVESGSFQHDQHC